MSSTANCAISYGTAFLDFDIIELTFCKDSVEYVFKVNADPIDFVPGGYSPNKPSGGGSGGGNDWLADLISGIEAAVKIVCVVALIVVVVIVLDKCTAIFDRLFGRRRR